MWPTSGGGGCDRVLWFIRYVCDGIHSGHCCVSPASISAADWQAHRAGEFGVALDLVRSLCSTFIIRLTRRCSQRRLALSVAFHTSAPAWLSLVVRPHRVFTMKIIRYIVGAVGFLLVWGVVAIVV